MKVFIDPRCQILYASYYIYGLYTKFGKKNVRFSNKYFTDLEFKGRKHYDQFFAFVIVKGNEIMQKIVVDFGDKTVIIENALKWSDVYGKINYNEMAIPSEGNMKIVPIPPSFGISIWNVSETYQNLLNNLVLSFSKIPTKLRDFVGNYKALLQRPSIEYYVEKGEKKSSKKYIFFVSSLWEHDNCIKFTNPLRYKFMQIAKEKADCFEGGFVANHKNSEYEKYADMVIDQSFQMQEYISKIKESMIVFNTPAVHDCHGWKLGEFFAMGKAIISTPLANKLEVPLVNGLNVVICETSFEIENAVNILIFDDELRLKLEENSKQYFKNYSSPFAVINRLIKFL